MRAVVLVGGQGTRLRPLTLHTPKQMLPVAGRPMIERVLAQLGSHGVGEVVLALGYKPDAFLAAYPGGRCAGVALRYAVEDTPLDTAGAVAFAARSAGIDDETLVVVNGDVLTDLDVSALVAFHRARSAQATIALTPVEDPSRYGVVPTDEHGRVLAFIEKPPPGEAPTHYINAGTYVVEPAALARIPAGRAVSIERETFPALVASGDLYALRSEASWIDAGTPGAYLAANLRYAEVRTAGGSVVDPAAKVADDAEVRASVVLRGAVVGAGAVVSDSIIGPGARIGEGARVEHWCIIGPGEEVPPGATVRGS